MASKYIIEGSTYNGDGTTSSAAASHGAAGAWNSLVAQLAGTGGAGGSPTYPAAGDDVYVKCATGTTTISLTATLTFSTTPTQASPINWVFDDGTIWAGNAGTVIIRTGTGTSYPIVGKDYHNFIGKNKNFQFNCRWTSATATSWVTLGWGRYQDIYFSEDYTANIIYTHTLGTSSTACMIVFRDCKFDCFTEYTTYTDFAFSSISSMKHVAEFWNCEFDSRNRTTTTGALLNNLSSGGGVYRIYGGKISNSNENYHLWTQTSQEAVEIITDGFDPGLTNLTYTSYTTQSDANGLLMTNIPGTIMGFTKIGYASEIHWRNGLNYPTLNGILPDGSSTYFSYKVYPKNTNASMLTHFPLSKKWYTGTAATKTVTVELLISNTYANPKQNEWWIGLNYVKDSDGTVASMSSFEKPSTGGYTNLASSSAGWSTTTYGATSYTKYKIALTTASAIKQYSMIDVKLYSSRVAPSATDFYFVDPEITIS